MIFEQDCGPGSRICRPRKFSWSETDTTWSSASPKDSQLCPLTLSQLCCLRWPSSRQGWGIASSTWFHKMCWQISQSSPQGLFEKTGKEENISAVLNSVGGDDIQNRRFIIARLNKTLYKWCSILKAVAMIKLSHHWTRLIDVGTSVGWKMSQEGLKNNFGFRKVLQAIVRDQLSHLELLHLQFNYHPT